ncbi:MAG: hypothetical protein EB150_02040 [Nitrososphaeria archaeon]|nr:hypothetical protein [Nitrososphaeria archaeon]NDB51135.1 hypothetical protein [Nitrosopumilaceae archaeon]NDB87845.1 hypothetical protein [Nitrososphaerota archaeon]NDB62963.1 hypothetical protein [Nitrosopumilaceae archaeon]NDB89764.1 hypothetical protein [Nitrososphaerota archaeon]
MFVKAIVAALAFALVLATAGSAFAETTITPINSSIGIEKTIVPFSAPKNNKLPWGFVEGKVANPVEGNPVIIQIFKNGDPVHFAQTDVKKDGSYEYKFRVRDVTNGKETKVFDGDYTVKIFKVVYLPVNANAV